MSTSIIRSTLYTLSRRDSFKWLAAHAADINIINDRVFYIFPDNVVTYNRRSNSFDII